MEEERYNAMAEVCRGLLRQQEHLPQRYKSMIKTAEEAVVRTFAPDAGQEVQEDLICAVEANLKNQKEWPYEMLQRKYMLPYSRKAFIRAKQLYVRHMAKRMGMGLKK